MKKFTSKQLKALKAGWKRFKIIEQSFHGQIFDLEKELSHTTGIEDIEFFKCDNEFVGIGNGSRTMKLLQREKLE